ncbi:MAG: glycosyltransferase [Bacteroidia bacterium]|nr:glycosyltransferase [Bacteroidia bacterium]
MAQRIPDFAIVIPCKNEAGYIERTLAAIQAQDALTPDTPIIIADAGSTDGTLALIEAFRQASGLNISLTAGGLPPAARNRGAALVQAPYIFFIDADIALGEPDTLSKALRLINNQNLDLVVTHIRCRDANWFDRFFWGAYGVFARLKVMGPVVTGMFICIRRDRFEAIGGFDERMLLGDDVEIGRQVPASKFAVADTWIETTNRRFVKNGYVQTVLEYIRVFFSRSRRLQNHLTYFENTAS